MIYFNTPGLFLSEIYGLNRKPDALNPLYTERDCRNAKIYLRDCSQTLTFSNILYIFDIFQIAFATLQLAE